MGQGQYTSADLDNTPKQAGQFTLADVDGAQPHAQPTATISNQPAPGTWPWFKTKFYQAPDATANALPAGGAMVGAVAGAPEGGPIGAVGGAGIGGMAGTAAKHLIRRAAGFEESNDPNAVANDIG